MTSISHVCSNVSNPPHKCGVRVERVYFYSEVELAVVRHEACENTQLDEVKEKKRSDSKPGLYF